MKSKIIIAILTTFLLQGCIVPSYKLERIRDENIKLKNQLEFFQNEKIKLENELNLCREGIVNTPVSEDYIKCGGPMEFLCPNGYSCIGGSSAVYGKCMTEEEIKNNENKASKTENNKEIIKETEENESTNNNIFDNKEEEKTTPEIKIEKEEQEIINTSVKPIPQTSSSNTDVSIYTSSSLEIEIPYPKNWYYRSYGSTYNKSLLVTAYNKTGIPDDNPATSPLVVVVYPKDTTKNFTPFDSDFGSWVDGKTHLYYIGAKKGYENIANTISKEIK